MENHKSGQFITGRSKLAQLCGVPKSTVEDILNYLETQQQIQQQKTTKYRLITILNWDTYQKSDSNSDNKATTKRQQSDTINNAKKGRKKEGLHSDVPSQDVQAFIDMFKTVNPNHERLFSNKTQRTSATNLLRKFGMEKMVATLNQLPLIIVKPFAPKITTPYELERDLGKLLAFVEQNKGIIKDKPRVVLS